MQREQSKFQSQMMVPFLVMQYSMDEKNDKQGGAFNRGSGDITEKWTEANILASSYQKRGYSLARSSHSEYPMAQAKCLYRVALLFHAY